MILTSKVKGFEGPCKPVWLNTNQVDIRMGGGVTGFFKNTKPVLGGLLEIKTGEEFHGMICNGFVFSTEGK